MTIPNLRFGTFYKVTTRTGTISDIKRPQHQSLKDGNSVRQLDVES